MNINITNDELNRSVVSFDKDDYPHIILWEHFPSDVTNEYLEIIEATFSRYTGFYCDDVILSKTVKSKCKSIKYRVLKR